MLRYLRVAQQDHRRTYGQVHLLVPVYRYRVGLLDAAEHVLVPGGEEDGAAPGGVNVKVNLLFLSYVGHFGQRVNRAAIGSPGDAYEGDYMKFFSSAFCYCLLQPRQVNAV